MKTTQTFKCHCCNKVFKTKTGFEKHVCKYQTRFVEIETKNWYNKWLKMKTIFKIRVSKDKNKEYYNIIHSSFYEQFTSFLNWSEENNILDFDGYLRFLKLKRYPMKNWKSNKIYHEYIIDYIKNELPALANERSAKFLKDNGITLSTITPNKLYFSILSGNISNKFLKYKKVDITKILDEGQLKDVKDLLV